MKFLELAKSHNYNGSSQFMGLITPIKFNKHHNRILVKVHLLEPVNFLFIALPELNLGTDTKYYET
jgi:hypothetical protein